MFGIFKKKAAAAAVKLERMENRDLMEAIVASAILVSYADGDCSGAELTKMQGIIESHDKLKHFGNELGKTIDDYCRKMEAGVRTGRLALMKEIEDVSADMAEKEQAFVIAIEVADAEGGISPEEYAVLVNIGKVLGLNPDKYI